MVRPIRGPFHRYPHFFNLGLFRAPFSPEPGVLLDEMASIDWSNYLGPWPGAGRRDRTNLKFSRFVEPREQCPR